MRFQPFAGFGVHVLLEQVAGFSCTLACLDEPGTVEMVPPRTQALDRVDE